MTSTANAITTNAQLNNARLQLASAKNATERKVIQSTIDSAVDNALLIVRFADDKKNAYTRIFNASTAKQRAKNARKFLRTHGYVVELLTKIDNVWTHALKYTGKYDKVTNASAHTEYDKVERQALYAKRQASKAIEKKKKASKE